MRRTMPSSRATIIAVALALIACGASSAPATTQAASSHGASPAGIPPGPIRAVLHAPGHNPKVGKWPITVILTKGGKPIFGRVSYQFLYGGQVVSSQPVRFRSPTFVGTFHDTIIWPATSVGYPLTLRILIQTSYGPTHIDYTVQVRR